MAPGPWGEAGELAESLEREEAVEPLARGEPEQPVADEAAVEAPAAAR